MPPALWTRRRRSSHPATKNGRPCGIAFAPGWKALSATKSRRFARSTRSDRRSPTNASPPRTAGRPASIAFIFPRGGGKTYSGLRFCVEMARRQNARHLFYFAPYKSITRQNADAIRKALGEDMVLEHHSDVLFASEQSAEQQRWLTLSQRWQGVPVICTTMVQLLNTLFAAPRQNVRRLSALAGSVLLLDEIQALPLQDTCLLNLALDTLARLFGCTVGLVHCHTAGSCQGPIPRWPFRLKWIWCRTTSCVFSNFSAPKSFRRRLSAASPSLPLRILSPVCSRKTVAFWWCSTPKAWSTACLRR